MPLPPQTAVLVLALAEIQEHGVEILLCAPVLQPRDLFTCELFRLAVLSKQKTVGKELLTSLSRLRQHWSLSSGDKGSNC